MYRLLPLYLACCCAYISLALAEASPPSQQKVKIGALLTLSGGFSSAGEDCKRGIEAALAVAGQPAPLEVLFADSKNEPTTAISEFQRLVNAEKAVAIYTHRSSIGMALNPIAQRLGVPLLGAVGHQDFANANKFSIQIWPRSDLEGRFMAEEFIRRGYKKAAVIFTEDEWTTSVTEGFRRRFSELGGSLVLERAMLPSEMDFRTVLLHVRESSPDAIYMNMLLPQIAPLLKQAQEMAVTAAVFSNFYMAKKEILEAMGAAALEGVRYAELDTDLPKLKEALGQGQSFTPAGLTVASYVATLLLVQTVSKHGAISSTEELYNRLLLQQQVNTPDYTYQIKDRYVQFPLAIKVMRAGNGIKESREH